MALSLTIDGKNVTAEPGEYLLDVARRSGSQIPSLCHHPKLTPYGGCRICLVEVTRNGRKKLTTACNYEVLDGIEVQTRTEEIMRHRAVLLELLLGQAPDSNRIKLLAKLYGVGENTYTKNPPPAGRDKCIVCGLCARVCSEVVGANVLSLSGRGATTGIRIPFDDPVSENCLACGACSSVCPSGAISMENARLEQLRKRPFGEQPCRYSLMGIMNGAICANDYNCSKCEVDQRMFEATYPEHPIFLARAEKPLPGWE